MTVAVLIFGEITPKYIAKAYPERLSMLFYPAIKAVYLILIPLNFVFIGWKNLISKIFSLAASTQREPAFKNHAVLRDFLPHVETLV